MTLRLIHINNGIDIICPNKREVCMPELMKCIESPRRAVPNCVVNICAQELPFIDENPLSAFLQ